ncbi:MAG: BON domain-containing protein [Rubricella sp.]
MGIIGRAALLAAGLALAGCGPLAVAGVTTAAIGDAQERPLTEGIDDNTINLRLDAELLRTENLALAALATRVVEGRVILIGNVPTPEDSIQAETVAWSIPGVRSVSNRIETGRDRTTVEAVRDIRIANQARLRLLNADSSAAINYSITVVNGVLHLTGLAPSEESLTWAVNTVRTVPGVQQVVSHVFVTDDPRRRQSEPRPTL